MKMKSYQAGHHVSPLQLKLFLMLWRSTFAQTSREISARKKRTMREKQRADNRSTQNLIYALQIKCSGRVASQTITTENLEESHPHTSIGRSEHLEIEDYDFNI